jgi:hypothetical protein
VEGKTLVQELTLNPDAQPQVLLLPARLEQCCQGGSRYHQQQQQQQQRYTAGSGRRYW